MVVGGRLGLEVAVIGLQAGRRAGRRAVECAAMQAGSTREVEGQATSKNRIRVRM